jgi:predicted NUDIX family phosphoesterase
MEFVLVVDRDRLFDLSFPQGFVAAARDRAAAADRLARIRRHAFFVERRKAEQDSSWKQIIPYVVVTRGDSLLLLERTKRQGEARLHGKLSIGVGGHINPVDENDGKPGDTLLEGLRRELAEELDVSGPAELRAAGFLNDDSTDVGAVRFGLVAVADARRAESRSARPSSRRPLRTPGDRTLPARTRCFETWSGLLVDRLDDVLASDLSLEEVFAARDRGARPAGGRGDGDGRTVLRASARLHDPRSAAAAGRDVPDAPRSAGRREIQRTFASSTPRSRRGARSSRPASARRPRDALGRELAPSGSSSARARAPRQILVTANGTQAAGDRVPAAAVALVRPGPRSRRRGPPRPALALVRPPAKRASRVELSAAVPAPPHRRRRAQSILSRTPRRRRAAAGGRRSRPTT